MNEKLTEEDFRMIKYFISEYGDIERWVGYESKKLLIEKELPDLIFALKMLKNAELALNYAISLIPDD